MLSYSPYGRRATEQVGFNPSADDPSGDYPADHPLLLSGVCASLPVFYPCSLHAGADRRDGYPYTDVHARSADADAGGNADPVVAADLHSHRHAHADAHAHSHSHADDDTDAYSHADDDTDAHPHAGAADVYSHANADADGHADEYSYPRVSSDGYPYTDGDTHRNADGDTGIPHTSAARCLAGAYRHSLAYGHPDLGARSCFNTCGVCTSAACPLRGLKDDPGNGRTAARNTVTRF